jgi:hypothetical protein
MKLRIITASLLLVLITAACRSENPVGPQVAPSTPAKDAGGWLGSGH